MQTLLALLANLLPASSVVLFGWSAFTLLLLYWLENLIIGAINVFKIAIAAGRTGHNGARLALGLIPFFLFHYELFCAIHGLLLWELFGDSLVAAPGNDLLALPQAVLLRLQTDTILRYNAALLAAYHVLAFLIYWVAQGEGRGAGPFMQVFAPYGRIAIVHLTILVAAVPVTLLGQPVDRGGDPRSRQNGVGNRHLAI